MAEKLTPLTDPNNVAWVFEMPEDTVAPEPEVVATLGPKMAAYSALVAAATGRARKKFDESKVKRGKGGKFAKKAHSGGPAPTEPAEAAPTAASGDIEGAPGVRPMDAVRGPGGTVVTALGPGPKKFGLPTIRVRNPDGTESNELPSSITPLSESARNQMINAPMPGRAVVLPDGRHGVVNGYPRVDTAGNLTIAVTPDGETYSDSYRVSEVMVQASGGDAPNINAMKTVKKKFPKKAPAKKTTPAKKSATAPTAAPAAVGGKKMTNAVIYGKHANGTILASTDGQSRMVYNAAGNNWTVQRRTPDGGWETTEVLGKGAAYKKAQELSDSWAAPQAGGDDEVDTAAPEVVTPEPPAPATPTARPGRGAFEDGWNDLSNVNLSTFAQTALFLGMSNNNADASNPGAAAKAASDAANQFGITPEQVLAIMDQRRGNTDYSDRVRAYLNGAEFPPSSLTAPPGTSIGALKKTAAAKKTAKKIAPSSAPVPTVAPSPASSVTPGKKIAAKKTASGIASKSPLANAQAGNPDVNALQQQNDAAQAVLAAQQAAIAAVSDPSLTNAQREALNNKFLDMSMNYTGKYGVLWTPNHASTVNAVYNQELMDSLDAMVQTPSPATPPPAKKPQQRKFKKGDTVKSPDGSTGEVVAVATTTDTKAKMSKVVYPDGTSKWFLDAELEDGTAVTPTSATPPTPTSLQGAKDGVVPGAMVSVLGKPVATVEGQGPVGINGEPTINMRTASGQLYNVPAGNVIPLTQAQIDAVAAVPPIGTLVGTPSGDGYVISEPRISALGNVGVRVDTPVGPQTLPMSSITILGGSPPPGAPVTAPATPAPAPSVTYDANGVPVLSQAQQDALQANFAGAGVNWYNDTSAIFDAAYAASQATGLSMEDVLKYADANYHKSSKFDGKPFQSKIEKWAKSSKGKAHIQATIGSAPATPAPAPASASSHPGYVPPSPMQAGTITPTAISDGGINGRFLPVNSDFPTIGLDSHGFDLGVELQAEMTAQYGDLTDHEYEALTAYTGASYEKMNNCLRHGNGCGSTVSIFETNSNVILHTIPTVNAINDAVGGLRPLTQNVTVFRGANYDIAEQLGVTSASDLRHHVGAELVDYGFTSTSTEHGMSDEWASMNGSDAVRMQIEVPAGTPAAYVDEFSRNPGESELILAPGTRFRITEFVDNSPNGAIIRVEVVR